jgi:mannose-6-phosphate isomerase-like protein (cupin superfamily)
MGDYSNPRFNGDQLYEKRIDLGEPKLFGSISDWDFLGIYNPDELLSKISFLYDVYEESTNVVIFEHLPKILPNLIEEDWGWADIYGFEMDLEKSYPYDFYDSNSYVPHFKVYQNKDNSNEWYFVSTGEHSWGVGIGAEAGMNYEEENYNYTFDRYYYEEFFYILKGTLDMEVFYEFRFLLDENQKLDKSSLQVNLLYLKNIVFNYQAYGGYY